MLKVKDLTISTKKIKLVKNISFELACNESLGIIGSSGSGKSLTAFCIMGLLDKNIFDIQGSIKLFDRELLNESEKNIAKIRLSQIAMIYQNPFNTFLPVEKIIKQFKRIYKIKGLKLDKKRIEHLLYEVELEKEHLEKFPFQLSGGQIQRLVIMTALLLNPKIIIADEITTALDSKTEEKIINLLNKVKKDNNISLIFITHDLSLINKITDRLIIMKNGEIIERGKTQDILNSPKTEYTKKLLEFSKLGE